MAKKPENAYKLPRIFQDDGPIKSAPPESKSWEEYEQASRLVQRKAQEIQKSMENLIHEWSEFEGLTLKAYKKMPNSDAMFSEGPFAPLRLQMSFRQNLAKHGWKWAAGLPWGPDLVKPFADVVKEACAWGQRLAKEQEQAKNNQAIE